MERGSDAIWPDQANHASQADTLTVTDNQLLKALLSLTKLSQHLPGLSLQAQNREIHFELSEISFIWPFRSWPS
jgi:hypothetical protein